MNIAHEMGWTVEMAAFESAFSDEGEMAITVDDVRPLNEVFEKKDSCGFTWPPLK